MQIRAAALSALVMLAGGGGVLSQQVAESPPLTATGRVVSTGNVSLAVQTDGSGEPTTFVVTTTTQVAPGLVAGSRVTVHYRLVGDRQIADRAVHADSSGTESTTSTGAAAQGTRPSPGGD
jgi:hypothetical protein